MAELKTEVNDASVEEFLNAIPDEQRRRDCFTIAEEIGQAQDGQVVLIHQQAAGRRSAHSEEADRAIRQTHARDQSLEVDGFRSVRSSGWFLRMRQTNNDLS
jgi:hypothetical protein